MAEMEDQNISKIKPALSHHSSARIPQLCFSSHCCILLGDNTDLFSTSFHNHFLNVYGKQQVPLPNSKTAPSHHIRIPTRIPSISYKTHQNNFAQTNKKKNEVEMS